MATDAIKIVAQNKKASHDEALKKQIPGVATGLAWTQVGGDTLQIEVNIMPGKGETFKIVFAR